MGIDVTLSDKTGRSATFDSLNSMKVAIYDRDPPPTGSVSRLRYYTALLASAGGITDMAATVSDTGTDGVNSDHTGPTFTFTAASGGLTGAIQIEIIDTGAGGNGILGIKDVASVNSDISVELTVDPTNGTNETGMDWAIPSTAVFTVGQNEGYMIHVMGIQILIADTAVVHSSFGNVSALSNGWDLIITEDGVETFLIEKAKTGGQVIAQAGAARAFGDGTKAFELESWNGTQDAQLIWLPVAEYVPEGIRIGQGSDTTLRAIVRDDLTGLTEMLVRLYGYKHFP